MQSYLYPTIRPATPIIYYILLPTIQYQSPLTHRKDTPLEPLLPPLYVIKVPHSRADQTKSFPTMKIKPTIIAHYISCSAPLISPRSSIQLSKPITYGQINSQHVSQANLLIHTTFYLLTTTLHIPSHYASRFVATYIQDARRPSQDNNIVIPPLLPASLTYIHA